MVRKQASLTPAVRHQESENDQGLAEAERCARRSSLMQQTKQLAACLRLSGNALLRRRSAKAQRTQPAPTEEKKYAPGAIRMIEIKRFMVYDHNVLRPGPKLNLLMGPNGTGKSTWVCAICLAFGQSTSVCLLLLADIHSFPSF
jgi:flagellar biosynthesis GTPase FlhF